MAIDYKQINKEFAAKIQIMTDLVAKGRGIEILLRIADQTKNGLKAIDTYRDFLSSNLEVPNLHPPKALPNLFDNPMEIKRLDLARDISDKLAHGIYRSARKLINQYRESYGIKTELNSDPLQGWQGHMKGHLIDDNGRKIDTINDTLTSTNKNLIIEEFDVFVHNNYHKAAEEIFSDAWDRILKSQISLSSQTAKLHMLRGFKRGKKTYVEP